MTKAKVDLNYSCGAVSAEATYEGDDPEVFAKLLNDFNQRVNSDVAPSDPPKRVQMPWDSREAIDLLEEQFEIVIDNCTRTIDGQVQIVGFLPNEETFHATHYTVGREQYVKELESSLENSRQKVVEQSDTIIALREHRNRNVATIESLRDVIKRRDMANAELVGEIIDLKDHLQGERRVNESHKRRRRELAEKVDRLQAELDRFMKD